MAGMYNLRQRGAGTGSVAALATTAPLVAPPTLAELAPPAPSSSPTATTAAEALAQKSEAALVFVIRLVASVFCGVVLVAVCLMGAIAWRDGNTAESNAAMAAIGNIITVGFPAMAAMVIGKPASNLVSAAISRLTANH